MRPLVLVATIVAIALAQIPISSSADESPVKWVRPNTTGSCPPKIPTQGLERRRWPIDAPTRSEDENVGNHGGANPEKDWLISRRHWDDGHGNDFTLEIWCIQAAIPYFSARIAQSKNGHSAIVATPLGGPGIKKIDHC